ncbi:Endothelin-converting enzyme 1 [Phytophthora nicotianae]|uniref:Endothelin-converting enzyme 1 n=1 Tax=Phytophthora nicotianae TaxID=4792 RepID=A0A0W8CVX9_PHYNI|nr:Endothelin-converting enzyme 1 [Phytophthora nicotianae]
MSAVAYDMKYRFLGNTGLLVSKFAVGSFVTFNTQHDFEKTYTIMEHAFKNGINFFDNAEAFADGESGRYMGKIIDTGIERGLWAREDLVIITKIFFGAKMFSGGGGPNDTGLSRKHIVALKRFGLDYVGLIFCNRQDLYTSMKEIVRATNYVIEQGWAFYWGTSEWTATEIMEACEAFDQTRYNILDRSCVDYDFVNLYKKYKYGVTAFYALADGVLMGKYSNGIRVSPFRRSRR